MKRELPELASDKAAADFVAEADLTEFDLFRLKSTQFEFAAHEPASTCACQWSSAIACERVFGLTIAPCQLDSTLSDRINPKSFTIPRY